MANSYYSHNTLMALGDVLARLLEISMIEVSDIIDDFNVSFEGSDEAAKKAKIFHEALNDLGPGGLVEQVLWYKGSRDKIVEILAYAVDSLREWNPPEEEEKVEEEDLF